MLPAQFPQAEMLELLSYLEGNNPALPVRKAVEDAYDLLGFGLGVALPASEEPRLTGLKFGAMTGTHHVAALKAASAEAAAGKIDWTKFLPVILSIIQQLLSVA